MKDLTATARHMQLQFSEFIEDWRDELEDLGPVGPAEYQVAMDRLAAADRREPILARVDLRRKHR